MAAVYILWARELKRYVRARTQVIASLGHPILYLTVLGFGLEPVFRASGHGSYLQFVAPGVIGMAIVFTSTFAGFGVLWDRRFGFLKETLVAPVPRLSIVAGRMLGSATIAVIQGTIVLVACIVAGFRPPEGAALPLALVFMALIALTFAGVGTTVGAMLREVQGFQVVMNLAIVPIFFLSGALFPLADLPAALTIATRVDPLSYGIDGLRLALTGASQFSLMTDLAVLGATAMASLVAAAYAFSRIQP